MHEEGEPSDEVVRPFATEPPLNATLVEADRLYYLEAQDFTD